MHEGEGGPETTPGAALRRLRTARGLSLKELSRLTHYSKGYLSKVETGEKALSVGVARRCDAVLETGGELTELAESITQARGGCPYRGLQPYGPEDSRWFFGRDRTVGVLVGRLAERMPGRGPLIVVAPSGAGKTSLLRAGLLPALRRGVLPAPGSRSWPAVVFTPGAHPVAELPARISTLTGLDPAHLAGVLADDPAAFAGQVAQAVNAGTPDGGPRRRLVLVVDQLEEIFTLCDEDAERRTFLAAVDALAVAGQPVVLGVRADFYGHCLNHPVLLETLREGQLPLGPMSVAELREVITGPAREAGLGVEPALVELLLRDLGVPPGADGRESGPAHEPGALPLLSHALLATWQHRAGDTLTVAGYRLTGGIAGAVAATAENVYTALDPTGQDIARRLLLHMVCVEESGPETRRPVDVRRLPPAHFPPEPTSEVIDAFATARLLTLDAGSAQLAHEALLRAWPRLREWIVADRAGLRTHRRLAEAAEAWEREHRDTSLLYRGTRLSAAREWAGSQPAALTTLERDFLDACLAAEAAEHRLAARRTRRRRQLVALLTTLLIVVVAAGGYAVRQRDLALYQRAQALSRQLAVQSELLTGDPATAARLATTAWALAPTPEARLAMVNVLSRPERAVLPGLMNALAAGPDGRIMAGAHNSDATVRLWDTATRRPLGAPLTGHEEPVSSVAFSRDGRTLATGSSDGTIRLWDVAARRQVGAPLTVAVPVLAVAFRPDGHTLASMDTGGTLRVWDLNRRTPIAAEHTPDYAGSISAIFSPDGRTMARTHHGNRTVRLWDTLSLREIDPVSVEDTPEAQGLSALAFSPDGRTLITSEGTTARAWDVRTGRQIGPPLEADDVWGGAAAITADGSVLATASSGKIKLWDMTTHRQIGAPLIGRSVLSMAFSPDGTTLWSSGTGDHTVRVWDVTARHPVGKPLTGYDKSVRSVAFSPDGTKLATGGEDHTVRLWDVAGRRQLGDPLTGHEDEVVEVAFSPDGRTLVSAGNDHTVRLWNAATRHPIGKPLRGHAESILAMSLSPDGTMLATSSFDTTVRLWDVAGRRQIGDPLTGQDVCSVAFSPDGRSLAVGCKDGRVRLWDVAGRRQVGDPLTGPEQIVYSVAFSPDGTRLATGGEDHTVRLWDVARRRQIGDPLTGHEGSVHSVAFSPDGTRLVTAGEDHTVRLWDVATGHPIGASLTAHQEVTAAVAFSPDGTRLATAGLDHTVRLWNVAVPPNLAAALCDLAGRSFTPTEWARYVPGEEFRPVCPQPEAVRGMRRRADLPGSPVRVSVPRDPWQGRGTRRRRAAAGALLGGAGSSS
ncbi:helix-turn-helix domain-containing protein [Nonomuraea bangladeshensis]|uniref:nSTAND1 domain-containing NTPase n=1 Tax=Nonomuraea bangladeshensis TaxID=404385 RepID=UPI003C2E1E8C